MSTLELIAYQPMQMLETGRDGKQRFRPNAVIQWLLANGRLSLKEMENGDFPVEDKIQIAQLSGYVLGEYFELPYVTDENLDEISNVTSAVMDFEASLGETDPEDDDD